MIPTRSSAHYPMEATLDLLLEASGLEREELMNRLAVLDPTALDQLVKDLRSSLDKEAHLQLRTRLEAGALRTITPRLQAVPV